MPAKASLVEALKIKESLYNFFFCIKTLKLENGLVEYY